MRQTLLFVAVSVILGMLLADAPEEKSGKQPIKKSKDVLIAEKVRKCAVAIYATHIVTTGKERIISSHHITVSFSGFLYDADGHIVTVAHPVKDAKRVFVQTDDKRRLMAKVVAVSDRDNIALLKIDTEGTSVEPLELAEEAPPVGSRIMVVSSPLGLKNTVVFGNISGSDRTLVSKGRIYTNMLQLSVPSSQSDPGGVVTDRRGRVIGMVAPAYIKPPVVARTEELLRNIAKKLEELNDVFGGLVKDEGMRKKLQELRIEARKLLFPEKLLDPLLGSSGITFAIPVQTLKKSVEMLIKRKEAAWLGIAVRTLTEEERTHIKRRGLLVVEVVKGSPSDEAGIRKMDIVLSLNGRETSSIAMLKSILSYLEVGDKVEVVVYRRGEEKKLVVTVGSIKQKKSITVIPKQPR